MIQVSEVPIDAITTSPYQPRHKIKHLDSLSKSIADDGLVNPITVRRKDEGYELVAGERRWRACRRLGLATILAIVRDLDDAQARRISYSENVQRDDLTRLEEIEAWTKHLDAQLWQDDDYRAHAEMNKWSDELDDEQALLRARWILGKLSADRANGTDYFMNKFIHKVEAVFAKHNRAISWHSFLNNDMPLLDLPEPVRETAIDKNLNKSQTKALGKLTRSAPDDAQEIMGRGIITVVDGVNFAEVPLEEASAREIARAQEARRRKEQHERNDRLVAEPMPEIPTDKYRVLYADPPWYYPQKIDKYGPAERHYPTMKTEEICDLGAEVKELTTSDAVLFLWSTSPKLKNAIEVAESWGFRYTGAMFVWDKVRHNYGHYNSVRHELLLICVKGSCTPDIDRLIDSVQTIERSDKHSQKPEEFRTIIDTLYPNGKRIELFARRDADGWDVWGNEI